MSSTLGIGGAILMMLPMLAVFDTATTIALIAPLMLVNAVAKLWAFRSWIDLRATLLAGGLGWPAALVAAWFVDRVDEQILKTLIVALVALLLARERGLGRRLVVGPRGLVLWGGLSGVLSGLTGVSGPTLALSGRAYGLTGPGFVGTIALIVVGLQVLRIPAYVATGVLTPDLLPLLVLLGTVATGAVLLGRRLVVRLEPERFRQGLDILLAGVAVLLLLDALGLTGR